MTMVSETYMCYNLLPVHYSDLLPTDSKYKCVWLSNLVSKWLRHGPCEICE